MQTANYLALNPKALAHLLSQEVNLEVVNGYPALVFPNRQFFFLHKRNYLLAHGLIALPANTHLHHVVGRGRLENRGNDYNALNADDWKTSRSTL